MSERREAVVDVAGVSAGPLTDVSLCIAVGERVAIIGESGCGKTTLLLRCLLGLQKPSAGSIEVVGKIRFERCNGSRRPWGCFSTARTCGYVDGTGESTVRVQREAL